MISRRNFISSMLSITAGLTLGSGFNEITGSLSSAAEKKMPYRRLGKVDEEIGLVSLGGEATVQIRDRSDEAVAIINRALDLGVNYIDTAPSYGNGGSEENIGKVMAERRQEVFLATKTHERSYDGTMYLLEESLKRLQTDYLDLYQLHNLRVDSDLNQALASDGALRALEDLKRQGVIGNIGLTGHKDPELLLRGIREYNFDSLLISLNAADIHYRPFQESLLQEAVDQELGIIAMKTLAVGRLLNGGGLKSVAQALNYVWSFPVTTTIIGTGSLEELEENIGLAEEFKPLSPEELMEIEAMTREYEEEGNFFKYYW